MERNTVDGSVAIISIKNFPIGQHVMYTFRTHLVDDASARVLFTTVLKEPHAIFCHPQNQGI